MQRTVLLLKSTQRKKLVALAKKANVSVAEIHRRAIDQYINEPKEDISELNLMIDVLLKSNEEAKKALAEAETALTRTLQAISAAKREKEK